MLQFSLRLLCNAAIFVLVGRWLTGFVVSSWTVAMIAALVFGVVNACIRPLLILLTLPASILTLGLFTLVIDAAVMALTALLVPGFTITGFFAAVAGWFLVSLGSWAVSLVLGTR
jgi:putative membrane protein